MKYLLLLPFLFASTIALCQYYSRLDSLFATYFKPGEPGGAVLIARNGQVIYKKAFGLEDMRTKKPVTTRSLFNIGSISKTFVAFGILKLAQEHRLSLDDSLYRYFPDFSNKEIAQKVKIIHLLTHTSGLPDSRKTKADSVFYLTAKDGENFAPIKQTQRLNFEPGTQFEYSNPAFNGLALIIEKITKQKWQDYIRHLIFEPAGMQLSTITDGPYPQKGVAHAYIRDARQAFIEKDYGEEPTFAAAGNGGVWSSVEELWKYEQAIQQHVFLDSNMVREARTIYPFAQWQSQRPPFIGQCWFISDWLYHMTGHTGDQGGFRGDYQWLEDQQLFYAMLSGSPQPVEEIRQKVFEILQMPAILKAQENDTVVQKDAAAVVRIAQLLLDGVARGDRALWDRYLHDRCIITVEDGRVLDKAAIIKELSPLPPGYIGSIRVKDPRVAAFGNTYVLSFVADEHLSLYGQHIHTGYLQTMTFIKTASGFSLAGAQDFELFTDPRPVKVAPDILRQYTGTYQLAPGVEYKITLQGDQLTAQRTGRAAAVWIPETSNVFYVKGQRGRKIFETDAQGRVTRLVDRRNGNDLIWKKADQ